MFVIFDMLGTLFSFEAIKDGFREKGLRQELADVWLARLGQYSMACALTGRYMEFNVLAATVLAQVFAKDRINEQQVNDLLSRLPGIAPWEDAEECLHELRADGHRLIVVTNWRRDDALRLLQRAGLWKWFERLCSADTVRVCKPHHALYEHIFRTQFAGPYECCLVSSHSSDILSADSLGMNSVYVSRLEGRWPFSGHPPGLSVSALRDVPKAISRNFGKPVESEEATIAGKGSKWYGEA